MLWRDDFFEFTGGEGWLTASRMFEGCRERSVAILHQTALRRDDAFGRGCGDFMCLTEGQAFDANQRVGKFGDGNTGSADVLVHPLRVDADLGDQCG
ncbi:hypothetical protein D3C87_1590900 [compost metagenome]